MAHSQYFVRLSKHFEKRGASGAGKPNGWLVAPTYFKRFDGLALHGEAVRSVLVCWLFRTGENVAYPSVVARIEVTSGE